MSTITTKDGTQIFYKDWGTGPADRLPPRLAAVSADDWDNQMMFFLAKGYRVIAHDRRGHGRSTQTATGNEMDTYAADVADAHRGARPARTRSMSATRPAAARSRAMSRGTARGGSPRRC